MASTVLTIAGTALGAYIGGPLGSAAIGGAIGGIVGGVVGSYVDPVEVRGPRLDDLRVMSSAYGQTIPLIYGTNNRIAGNVIWSSGLKEHSDKESAGKGGGNTITNYTYSADIAIGIGSGPCSGLRRIWANGKLLWDINNEYSSPTYPYVAWSMANDGTLPSINVASIAFYPGNDTQLPDPTIEANLGVGETPAYRGTCYVVLTGLQLADYGNSIPNLEFELDGLAPRNVGDVLRDLCDRSNLSVDEYAVHPMLSTIPIMGYNIAQSDNVLAAITPLLAAYFVDCAEQYGAIRFVPRGRGPLATLQLGDLAAGDRQDGGEPRIPLTTTRSPDHALPREASITYRDPELDYQTNTQRASRAYGDAATKLNVSLPVVLDKGLARMVADRILWEAWAARTRAQFSTSERFGFLYPSDVFVLPVAQRHELFIMQSAQRGDNGQIDVVALSNDPFVYDGSTDGSSGILPPNEMREVGDTFVYVFNAPILFHDDTDTGFNMAVDAVSSGWRGGQMFRSTNGVVFSSIGSTGVRTTTGTVAVALPAGPTGVFDDKNTIDVVLHYVDHELESVGDAELWAGNNGFFLGRSDGSGGEVIQFANAQLLSSNPKTYRLSGLLRGRRATEHEVANHVTDEIFVLLEQDLVKRLNYGVTDWYVRRWYKGVSIYQYEPDVTDVQEFVNRGERAMCRSPVFANASRDGSNNLTVSWYRRIRGYTQLWGTGPLPLDEPVEKYEVDIIKANSVVRTITVSSPAVTYSAANQAADGVSGAIKLRIYQISGIHGRGHPLEITV